MNTHSDVKTLRRLAAEAGEVLHARSLMLVTAESCTGGMIGQAITGIPGSSAWYEGGYIVYTNQMKISQLGVKPETLAQYGAVSEPAVREMARGALQCGRGRVALAVSGIAGPSGGTPEKPLGTVCLAWSLTAGPEKQTTLHFDGDREAVRMQASMAALRGLLELLGE